MKAEREHPYYAAYSDNRWGWDIFINLRIDDGETELLRVHNYTRYHPHGHLLAASETEEQAWKVFDEIHETETELEKMNINNYGFKL